MVGCTVHTAEFFEKLGTLDSQYDAHRGAWLRDGMHTSELDSAVGCTPQSQTDLKMSVFCVFVLATSFNFVLSKNVLSKKDFLNNL